MTENSTALVDRGRTGSRPRFRIAALFALVALCVAAVLPGLVYAQPSASLSVDPATKTVDVGDSFTVDVVVSASQEHRGAQCAFSFNPDVLQCDEVEEGAFYADWASANGATTLVYPQASIDNSAGEVADCGISIMGTAAGGPTGSGQLLIYHFTALADGTTALTLSNGHVADAEGYEIDTVTLSHGEVIVGTGGGGGTPTPEPTESPHATASPTPAPTLGANGTAIEMTVNIAPAIAFEVSPSSVDFGTVSPGQSTDPKSIEVKNTGGNDIEVTADVTDDSAPLFKDGLKLDGESWENFREVIAGGGEYITASATIEVPSDYGEQGSVNGVVVFWAAATQ